MNKMMYLYDFIAKASDKNIAPTFVNLEIALKVRPLLRDLTLVSNSLFFLSIDYFRIRYIVAIARIS